MNEQQLRQLVPGASESFIRANTIRTETRIVVSDRAFRPSSQLEPNPGNGAVGEVQVQKPAGRRFLVRVKSYRKRLLDEDNLCEKYFVDLLRNSGVIPSDAPGQTKIEVCQEKVGPKEPERTVIEVFSV